MAVPRVYVRRGTTVWSVTNSLTSDILLTQDALTLIFLYLYTIGPKGAKIHLLRTQKISGKLIKKRRKPKKNIKKWMTGVPRQSAKK